MKPSLLLFGQWAIFAFLHSVFTKYFLYWEVLMLDTAMHLWGGYLLVTTWLAVQRSHRLSNWHTKLPKYLPIFLFLLVIVGWEIFKYYIRSTVFEGYIVDTVTDLLAGLFGGLAAFWYHRSRTIDK
jgi:hypothetical protein